MRKITIEACDAFEAREKFSKSNTHTDGDALFLHGNKIAEWRDDGLHITNAGWPTITTKERLNGLKGVNIAQKAGIWYLNGEKWSGNWAHVATFTGDIDFAKEKKDRAMLKRIKAYSNLYKAPYPMPTGGDCWCCLGIVRDGDTQHLLDHIEEGYIHGTMIVNAMKEAGYSKQSIAIALYSNTDFWAVQPAIYKFLKKRLTNLAN